MTSYQNEHVTVCFERPIQAIRQTWVGLPTSESYRNGWLASLQLAEQYHVKKWLVDQAFLKQFNGEDLVWSIQQGLPRAVALLGSGARVAVVLSRTSQFVKLGADILLQAAAKTDHYLESRYFFEPAEARKWLVDNLESRYIFMSATPWPVAGHF